MKEPSGFFDYKVGQTPNIAMLLLGYFYCCGVNILTNMHAFRRELKRAFPKVDDSLHWLCVFIPIIGLYQNQSQLTALENQKGLIPDTTMPWFMPILIPFFWPLAIADHMSRLNALVAAETDAKE